MIWITHTKECVKCKTKMICSIKAGKEFDQKEYLIYDVTVFKGVESYRATKKQYKTSLEARRECQRLIKIESKIKKRK